MCEERIRKRIRSHDPDVVISVHPLMNGAPQAACRRISAENGRPLPFFTVVTDLGSAHCTWFSKKVEKMFIASEKIRRIAKARGRVPDEKLILSGLPIRHEFAVRAKRLGDRTTDGGRRYQRSVRLALDLPCEGKIVLLMGGGEGVSLENIPTALFSQFCQDRINVTIIVICGRNARLRQRLLDCDWDSVRSGLLKFPARTFFPSSLFVPAKISAGGAGAASNTTEAFKESRAEISVLPLGFVTNIDAYMVASDVLISKAGPGTIAEAAAVGLPIMLTSYLPGQEEGNVDFVLESKFGSYQEDPTQIAREVSSWLGDPDKLCSLSKAAKRHGTPRAAANIAIDIGDSTLRWKEIQEAE
mmetsp:Transcript_14506/g.31893  ORF Transcript_14506/g.31893 Transcript_14506/m.31893 type:complete len:358 (-) Transcript_14506:153-1226(-)